MNRIFTMLFLFVSFSLAAVAGSVHSVEVIPLDKTPLLSSADFSSAEVSGTGKKATLFLQLTSSAAKKMKAYTEKNVGQILPFIVDGKIIKAPLLREPIKTNSFQVEPMDKTVADDVAQFINSQR